MCPGFDSNSTSDDDNAIAEIADGTTSGVSKPRQKVGSDNRAWTDSSITASVLPTGASTSANQTNASQKTQLVDGAGAVVGTAMANGGVNHLPVYLPLDVLSATQNITTQDIGSSTTAGVGGVNYVIGTPTAGSAATFTLSSVQAATVQITGIWTGTLMIEVAEDGGTIWMPRGIHIIGTSLFVASVTANVFGDLNAAAKTNVRVRASAAITGTAVVRILSSDNVSTIYVANGIRLQDSSSSTSTTQATIKAASTAALTTDTALVVAINPATALNLPTGAATSALQTTANTSLNNIDVDTSTIITNQTNGTQKTQVVDGSGNVAPAGDTIARSSFVRITDGVDAAEVKAASTAATASDPSLVVAISPNTPVTVSTTRTSLTANSPTAVSVGNTSASAVASNANRKGLVLTNTSTHTISLGIGAAAVVNSGITLLPGGVWVMDEFTFTTGAINAIASVASSNLAAQEFQ